LIGRISTMLRTLRASTPVESFCDVVRIVGMVFLVVLEIRQILIRLRPSLPSPGARCSAVASLGAIDYAFHKRMLTTRGAITRMPPQSSI
jgi:hypothetical protein